MKNLTDHILDKVEDTFKDDPEGTPNLVKELRKSNEADKMLLQRAIQLLVGYNDLVKKDYKLDKEYSPKTDIDQYLELPHMVASVKYVMDNLYDKKLEPVDCFGDYEKEEHLVRDLDGVVFSAWPNAGKMNELADGVKTIKELEPHEVNYFIGVDTI